MRCVILLHLAHRKATGKMLSSLERELSRKQKKVRHDYSELYIVL